MYTEKEYLEDCIRKAAIHQKKYADLYEKTNDIKDLATLQAYGVIISNLEDRLRELNND